MKKAIIILSILATLLSIVSYHFFREYKDEKNNIKSETITVTEVKFDTIRVSEPYFVYSEVIRLDTIKIPIKETDSIEVTFVLPIEQKTYQDSNYKAVINGFKPNLISLELYPKTVTVTNTVYKNKRFGVGIHTGIGYTGNGFSPYIGIGINYKLFDFY